MQNISPSRQLVARDRSGATLDAVLPRLDAASLEQAFGERIPPSSDFCCDGGKAITAFGKRAKLKILNADYSCAIQPPPRDELGSFCQSQIYNKS